MCNGTVKIESRTDMKAYAEQVSRAVSKTAKESAERIIKRNENEEG